ncbi:MAG TPA: TauD/TfdA family dioxygenase [Mycobacterium sp.]|nr:TauD/TfdA family dioxygenase [Mycobacterium sp.]
MATLTTQSASGATVVRPDAPETNLYEWTLGHAAQVDTLLREPGAIIFRGFAMPSREDFEKICTEVSGPFMEYEYRSNNRQRLTGSLFNSTEYPASERIPFHNEMSYFAVWPRHVWFLCEIPAAADGDTPLADSAEVYRQLHADIREPFERLGVRYTRTIGPDVDLSWRDVFQTDDQRAVGEYCDRFEIEHEWIGDETVRTAQNRPAVVLHPHTGDRIWFNQAHLFHPSSLGEDVHHWLLRRYGEDNLPRNAMFGDGSPIPLPALEAIRATYARLSMPTNWESGDVLVFDNMRYAHARDRFTAPRRIVVGLTGAVDDSQIQLPASL